MALQSSGAISLSQIAGEFGGSIPHSLSEYYGAASGVPSSGPISFSDFYGKSNTITLTYELIGAGGGGGGGWTSTRSATSGEASTLSYGGTTITSSGGAAGATTANTGQGDGSPTYYGVGGSEGANSDSSRQTAGTAAPATSYGAGGGGGGANTFAARNGGIGGFSGGQHLAAYSFIDYAWNTTANPITRYTGQPHTGTLQVTPGSTVSIYVGVNGWGTDAENPAYSSADPGTDGRKGAGGYCKVTVSGSSSEFTVSGSHTYTVPS